MRMVVLFFPAALAALSFGPSVVTAAEPKAAPTVVQMAPTQRQSLRPGLVRAQYLVPIPPPPGYVSWRCVSRSPVAFGVGIAYDQTVAAQIAIDNCRVRTTPNMYCGPGVCNGYNP